MSTGKKAYPIRQLIHWYVGNHCMRKCFDDPERLRDHSEKLEDFANRNPDLKMTHREFLELFNLHMTVCTLDPAFKQRSVSWKLLDIFQRTPNYDSSKIVINAGRIQRKDGMLEEPRPKCRICAALKVP